MLYILFYYLFSCGFIDCMIQDYEDTRNKKIGGLCRLTILVFLSPFVLPVILGAYVCRLCDKIDCEDEED